jgi:dTDP-4-amino-4,6-dideoxygalactose transaminase
VEKSRNRERLVKLNEELLGKIPGIELLALREGTTHARHLFPILVDPSLRDSLIDRLHQVGINVMVNYRAIHLLSYFANEYGYKEGDFPVAEKIGSAIISLPLYPTMPEKHVIQVAEALGTFLA